MAKITFDDDFINESDLRDALEDAAAANSSSTDTFVAEVALAHWRATVGTPDAIKPDSNDGYAVRLVDQIASGYIVSDGPWWISNDNIRALEVESGAAGDTEQVKLCRAALDEGDEDARALCVSVIADARIRAME